MSNNTNPSNKSQQMVALLLRRRAKQVPVDQLDGANYQPSRVSLGEREANAVLTQAKNQGDDANEEEGGAAVKTQDGIGHSRNGFQPQNPNNNVSSVIESSVSVRGHNRQAHRSQSQPPVSRGARALSYAPMSGLYASADDLELEQEARRRRRRSLYYECQRAAPSESVLPPIPTRRELVSRNEFWETLDKEDTSSPPTTSTGQSETPSRLQRVRARLKWRALKEVFGI